MFRLLSRILLASALVSAIASGEALYSIAGDDSGVGRRVTLISPGAGTAQPLFDLGDGSRAFTGITYNPAMQLFYAVAGDSFGNSTLVSFDLSGVTTDLLTLSSSAAISFNGGLVYDASDNEFYGLANKSDGNATLYRIDLASSTIQPLTEFIGPGFLGGLTVGSAGNILYAVLNDSSANASLVAFLVSAHSASKAGGAQSFGQGFYGGVYFDGTTIYGIGSDAFAAGSLYTIDSQTASTQLFGVGYGYYQAGLTAGPEVPEPATFLLFGSGISFLIFWRKR